MDQTPKSLKIAYITQSGFNLLEETGEAIHVKYSLRGLQDAGHHINFLTLNVRETLCYEDLNNLEDIKQIPVGVSGTKIFNLFESVIRRLQGELHLPYFAFFDSLRMYEACLRYLPIIDVCHEHFNLFAIGAALACWRLKKPYIITFAADPFLEMGLSGVQLRGFHKALAILEMRLAFNNAAKIICVSEPARQNLISYWQVAPDKVVVIPNGVDIDLFKPVIAPIEIRAKHGFTDEPIVMFVGGFMQWHGLEQLIENFQIVLKWHPTTKLILVGDGPARQSVQEKISGLGLDDMVKITGYIPHHTIPEMLALADVVVIPYPKLPQELWFSPLKLFEYMSAGKAIVATRDGQISTVIIHGENGLLVEPGDYDSFMQNIIDLISYPELRKELGQNARHKAVSQHSWEQHVKEVENLYNDILST